MDAEFVQISTTTGAPEDARKISRALVDQRLAGCVQIIGPVESTYRWQGRVEQSQEWLCLIKTRASTFSNVEEAIRELHPYDEPEIIAMPILRGSESYLKWLGEQVGVTDLSDTTNRN